MNLRHPFICKRLALAGFLSLTLASQTAIASDSGTPLPPARAGGLSQLERIPLAKLLQQPQGIGRIKRLFTEILSYEIRA